MQKMIEEMLRQDRKKLSPVQRRASYTKRFHWKYPVRAEQILRRHLHKELLKVTDKISIIIGDWLAIQDLKTFKRDDADYYLEQKIRELEYQIEENPDSLTGELFATIVLLYYSEIQNTLTNETRRFLAQYLSKEIELLLPNGDLFFNRISTEIRNKLREYAVSYFKKVNTAVEQLRLKQITVDKFIYQIGQYNKNLNTVVPNFLGRDLTGTYTSAIQSLLFQYLGFETYVWQTANDEKVRGNPSGIYPKAIPSHYDMEGKTCLNTDPTVYSNDNGKTWTQRTERMPRLAPGEDYNCRCMRGIDIVPLLKKIDKEL